MKKSAIAICFLFLFVFATANAQDTRISAQIEQKTDHSIDSDSVFFLTDTFLKSKAKSVLNNLLTHFHFTSDKQNVGVNPTIQLNQIDVTVSPGSYNISDSDDGLAFVATNNSLRIKIGEIAVHESVRREVNGVIANIRVDASCKGESLAVTDPESTIVSQLLPAVDGGWLKIRFVNPAVRLVAPKMQMSSYKCTGAEGFEDLIDATIKNALGNTQNANSLIAQLITENVTALSDKLSFNWAAPRIVFGHPTDLLNPQGWALPEKIEVTKQNDWQTTGTFRVILPTVVDKNTPHQKFNKWPFEVNTDGAYVAVPDSAFLAWVKNYFAPGQWQYKSLANDFSGFNDLLKSSFLEYFFWPDLRKYPKTQQFQLVATTLAPPKLAWLTASSFSLDVNILVKMSTNNAPYANFQIHLQTEMEFSVVSTKVNKVTTSDLVLVAKDPNIKVSYKWAPTYCGGGKKCGSIATSVISDALDSYLMGQKFIFALPAVDFAGTVIQPQSVTRNAAAQAVVLQLSPL